MTVIIVTSIICATVLTITILKDIRKQQEQRKLEKTLNESAEILDRNLTYFNKGK